MGTLANGIKDIFSTSQTTATHLPVCASDGTPQGRISVGDLASVLGGLSTDVSDFSLAKQGCVTRIPTGVDGGRPADCSTGYSFYLFKISPNYILGFSSETGISYIKTRITTSSAWSAWQKISTDIPSFYKNYNDLSRLATALGDSRISTVLATQSSSDWLKKTLTLSSNGIADLIFIPNSGERLVARLINRSDVAGYPLIINSESFDKSGIVLKSETYNYTIGMKGLWCSIVIIMIQGTYTVTDYSE